MGKERLLAALRGERAEILAELAATTDAELHFKPGGRWSIAEVLRHLMDFETDILAALDALAAGREPAYYAVKDWDAYNAGKAAQWAQQPVADIRAALVRHRSLLEERVQALTEAQLQAEPRYGRVLAAAAAHDFEHLPGIRERQALARGDRRRAAVHHAEIARNELLAVLRGRPLDAYAERLPGKWSIQEILIHLAVRDRIWAGVVRSVSAGGSDALPHRPEELEEHNRASVAAGAHWTPDRVLHELGEARGLWHAAMLAAPDHLPDDERWARWVAGRLAHDRHHVPQIIERLRNWRRRQGA